MAKIGYRPELDGLRAVAVLAVVAYHFWGDTPLLGRSRSWSPSLGGGFLGVALFFVLSGFLITRLLIEEHRDAGRISIAAFYARRVARLLPALALVLLVAWAWVGLRSDRSWSEISLGVIGSATYSANWMLVAGRDLEPLGHTWSLSVEEQFYIVWPLVVIAFGGIVRRLRLVAVGVLAVSALGMAGRSFAGVATNTLLFSTDTRGALSLMAGCVLALWLPTTISSNSALRTVRIVAGVAGAVLAWLVLVSGTNSTFMVRGGFVIAAGAIVAVVIGSLNLPGPRRALSVAPLVWLGRLSYGLYLWHKLVYAYLVDVTGSRLTGSVYNAACVLVSVGIAAVSYTFVEMPVRRWAGPHIRRLARRGQALGSSVLAT